MILVTLVDIYVACHKYLGQISKGIVINMSLIMIVNGIATNLIQSLSVNGSFIHESHQDEYGCDIKTQKCHFASV